MGSAQAMRLVEPSHSVRRRSMWFLVQVVKGSKHYEPESPVGNRVLISDTTDMVISGRALGGEGYRFEARKGTETFVIKDFRNAQAAGVLAARFTALAQQVGALALTDEPLGAGAA
jgi:hypothetical protein